MSRKLNLSYYRRTGSLKAGGPRRHFLHTSTHQHVRLTDAGLAAVVTALPPSVKKATIRPHLCRTLSPAARWELSVWWKHAIEVVRKSCIVDLVRNVAERHLDDMREWLQAPAPLAGQE